MGADMEHVMDETHRARITAACDEIARVLLEIDNWRSSWRAEVDGCVFKFKVDGYPKYGSERYKKRQAHNDELMKEYEDRHE